MWESLLVVRWSTTSLKKSITTFILKDIPPVDLSGINPAQCPLPNMKASAFVRFLQWFFQCHNMQLVLRVWLKYFV